MSPNELQHHGIFGMKWGVRRYQNEEADMNEYKIVRDKSHLAHHGILGQKWGVRRFQNEDGSLTAEGRERYGAHPENVDRNDLKNQVKLHVYKHPDSAFNKRVNDVYEKSSKQMEKDEDYGTLKKLSDMLSSGQLVLDGDAATVYNDLIDSFEKKGEALFKKMLYSDIDSGISASMLLKDLGYDDTAAGRAYISSILKEDLDEYFM